MRDGIAPPLNLAGMADDDDDHEHHGIAFPVPIPSGLMEALSDRQDRRRMSAEAAELEITNFLERLPPSDLLTVRRILNLEGESAMLNYLDGQVHAILRLVHRVDPDTGQPLDALPRLAPEGGPPTETPG
jgi:hypothetical protein